MAMSNQEVADNLKDHIPHVMAQRVSEELELVDVIVKGNPPQRKVQVVLYRDGGLPLDDIARAAQAISAFLDEELAEGNDLIAGQYTLEVTSPGLNWPLKNARDFTRVKGAKVKIVTQDKKEIIGEVMQIQDQTVTICTKLKNETVTHEIAYVDIASAAQALPW